MIRLKRHTNPRKKLDSISMEFVPSERGEVETLPIHMTPDLARSLRSGLDLLLQGRRNEIVCESERSWGQQDYDLQTTAESSCEA